MLLPVNSERIESRSAWHPPSLILSLSKDAPRPSLSPEMGDGPVPIPLGKGPAHNGSGLEPYSAGVPRMSRVITGRCWPRTRLYQPAWCSMAQFSSTSPRPMASKAPSMPRLPI